MMTECLALRAQGRYQRPGQPTHEEQRLQIRSAHHRGRATGPSREKTEAAVRIGRMLDHAFEPLGLDSDPRMAELLARLNQIG